MTSSRLELGSLSAASNSAPVGRGKGEGEDSRVLLDTGGTLSELLPFPLDAAATAPDAPPSTMLVSVSPRDIDGEGSSLETAEPERLAGTGMLIPLVISADTDGDCVGRILGRESELARSLIR